MTQDLESTFRELGLAQYLGAFVDQGFDTWETILDIQESDLDALGVKLGHRRKLQRRIANARGIAPSVSLPAAVKATHDDTKQDGVRHEQGRTQPKHEGITVTKRKYRRHPKSDENAPERPPSAYVLFSNKMRDDLKSHNLTFTEIAKLVGENWQSLPSAEKEGYESQANAAKENYHRKLAEYKKTPEYRKYAQYLQDFKEKQANQIDHKRIKLDQVRIRHGSTSSSATPASGSGSGSTRGSRSGSERMQGSEPPPSRQERVNSTASTAESQRSTAGPNRHLYRTSMDEPMISPRVGRFESGGAREAQNQHRSSWRDIGRGGDLGHLPLPSLSDVLEDGRATGMPISASPDGLPHTTSGFVAANQRRSVPGGPPGMLPGRVPSLQHEASSSSGSSGSGGSFSSYGRTPPGDGSLPMHALLSNRPMHGSLPTYEQDSSPTFTNLSSPIDQGKSPIANLNGPVGYGFQSAPSALQHMHVKQANGGDVVMTSAGSTSGAPQSSNKDGFDGMSALLRAGEIVGRRDGD